MFSNWCQRSTIVAISLMSAVNLFAADNRLVRQSLDELAAAKSQTDILLRSRLAPQDYERVRYVNDRLLSATDLLAQSLNQNNPPPYPPPPGPGPHPGPYPPPVRITVDLFNSDSCSSDFIGTSNESTDCLTRFRTAPSVWGVKVNGNQCMNIEDMPAVQACEAVRGLGDPNHVKFYHSDSCSDGFIAAITPYTECSRMPNKSVWAISRNGICQDISDISMADACERFRP